MYLLFRQGICIRHDKFVYKGPITKSKIGGNVTHNISCGNKNIYIKHTSEKVMPFFSIIQNLFLSCLIFKSYHLHGLLSGLADLNHLDLNH